MEVLCFTPKLNASEWNLLPRLISRKNGDCHIGVILNVFAVLSVRRCNEVKPEVPVITEISRIDMTFSARRYRCHAPQLR